jgi:hypothetical protein
MKRGCPVCKKAFELISETLSEDLVCRGCGNVAVVIEGRPRAMTVKEFVGREAKSQAMIRRAIAKAAATAEND